MLQRYNDLKEKSADKLPFLYTFMSVVAICNRNPLYRLQFKAKLCLKLSMCKQWSFADDIMTVYGWFCCHNGIFLLL